MAIEGLLKRFAGIEGVTADGVPPCQRLASHLVEKGEIHDGVAIHLANACLALGKTPAGISEMISGAK